MRYRVVERTGRVEQRYALQFRVFGVFWVNSCAGPFGDRETAEAHARECTDDGSFRVVWPR